MRSHRTLPHVSPLSHYCTCTYRFSGGGCCGECILSHWPHYCWPLLSIFSSQVSTDSLHGCSRTVQYNLLLYQCLQSLCLLYLCTYCASYRILTHPHCLTYSAPVIPVIPGVIDSPHFMARARIPSATALRELPKACLELWRALFSSLSKYGAPRSSELLAPQPCHPLPYGSTYSIH